MSQLQISHNNDLKRLRDEGFQINLYGGQIIVHHIPYVNSLKEIKYGVLVSDFNVSGTEVLSPRDHVMKFCGEHPCNKDGSVITGIQHGQTNVSLGNGLTINYTFSNKPNGGFKDFYEKFNSYIRIISAPAISLDESVTSTPFKPIQTDVTESVFKYLDTNSSRANIDLINNSLSEQRIAIVGLGGTGAYILDLIAKSCVKEIHLFDGDILLNHNAFRSPGAASIEDLESRIYKVDYYNKIYSNIRHGIFANNQFISNTNLDLLKGFDYVFLCIDDNKIRSQCVDFFIKNQCAFIDVGLGVNMVDDSLIGTIRVTSSTKNKTDHLAKRIPFEMNVNNEYSTNIQIAELNSLNATLAVLKWKKLSGFYQDLTAEHNLTFSLNDCNLIIDDTET
jgi:tRNA A37 threonylcarbamoyladenosine dehydratase